MDDENDSPLRKAAQQVLSMQPIPAIQARISELGRKANEGLLSNDESTEYRSLVEFGDLMTLIKLRAQRILELPPDQDPSA